MTHRAYLLFFALTSIASGCSNGGVDPPGTDAGSGGGTDAPSTGTDTGPGVDAAGPGGETFTLTFPTVNVAAGGENTQPGLKAMGKAVAEGVMEAQNGSGRR